MSKTDEKNKVKISSTILKVFPVQYKSQIQKNQKLAIKEIIDKSTYSNKKDINSNK